MRSLLCLIGKHLWRSLKSPGGFLGWFLIVGELIFKVIEKIEAIDFVSDHSDKVGSFLATGWGTASILLVAAVLIGSSIYATEANKPNLAINGRNLGDLDEIIAFLHKALGEGNAIKCGLLIHTEQAQNIYTDKYALWVMDTTREMTRLKFPEDEIHQFQISPVIRERYSHYLQTHLYTRLQLLDDWVRKYMRQRDVVRQRAQGHDIAN